MKFNEKVKNIGKLIQKVFKKYPITMILIYFCTIFMVCVIQQGEFIISEEKIEDIMVFSIIWGIGTFFSEIMFQKPKSKIMSYIITLAVSGVLTFFTIKATDFDEMIYRIDGSYIATLILISIYYIMIKLKKELPEYLLEISVNILKSTIIYGVLAGGIALIIAIFSALIYNINSYILNAEILLLGIFYVPSLISSITVIEDASNFFKKLVKNVLMPLVIATFVIVYIYIIKILIKKDMPSNQIFRILTSLFVIGGLIWTFMQSLKDESIMYKISNKLPYVFIPLICLQIYTLGARIKENGITPLRYTCMLIIAFEIIYILIFTFKKENLKKLLLVLAGMLVITLVIPGINIADVSNNSQIKRLSVFKSKNEIELSDDEKEEIYGAYMYLVGTTKGKKYIDDNYSEEEKDKIAYYAYKSSDSNLENLTEDNDNYKDREYISIKENDSVNISGYNKIIPVSAQNTSSNYSGSYVDIPKSEREKIDDVFTNVTLINNSGETVANVNVLQSVNDYIKNYNFDTHSAKTEFNREIKIDENKTFMINQFSIYFNRKTEKCISYTLNGYLLEK